MKTPMTSLLTTATAADAADVAALRNAVASALTAQHGIGHWSSVSTLPAIRSSLKRSSVYIVRDSAARAVATVELTITKPAAIDSRCFTRIERPLYVVGMAVDPGRQRSGIGRACMADAVEICREWPADGLRLDAYDDAAGASDFYRKCGFAEVGRGEYRGRALIYFERLV